MKQNNQHSVRQFIISFARLTNTVDGLKSCLHLWRTSIFATLTLILIVMLSLSSRIALANMPGGGNGTGPNVTVTDNGDNTVTMANGIISIVIVKSTGRLNSVTYTHKNSGRAETSEVLQGRGQYYYGGFMLGSGVYDYSLAADPAGNGGGYADVPRSHKSARRARSRRTTTR